MSVSPWPVLLFLLFALLAGLMSASQAALHHINRVRLRSLVEAGTSRAAALKRVLEEPSSLFSAMALLGTLAIAGATLCAADVVVTLWSSSVALAVLAALLFLVLLMAIQVSFRALAMHYPEAWALRLVGPLVWVSIALAPVLLPLLALQRALLRALGVTAVQEAPAAAEEELRRLVEEESGVLEQDEREMIQGIFEMDDRPVREVMVPRIDMTALPDTSSVGEAADLAIESGYTRFPVYKENLDNVLGVLVVKDLLAKLKAGQTAEPILALLRPAYFVPETKKIDDLLREMQERHVQMAIVVDEYGGTAGLVTVEDLVEEIVGEIQDEYDTEEALFRRVNEREAEFDARASLALVDEVMGLHLDVEDQAFDTLGGLLYERLGRVPVPGDVVHLNGATLAVMSTDGRRVTKVRVRLADGQPSTRSAA